MGASKTSNRRTRAQVDVAAYVPFARRLARGFYLPGGDRDDLEGEALLGLTKAARDYRPEMGDFLPFAQVCIRRQLWTAIKLANAHKHVPLTSALRAVAGENGSVFDAVDLAPDERSDPARVVEAREELAGLLETIAHDLSPLERRALVGIANGLSYAEIAGELGLPVSEYRNGRSRSKAIDNALQRARRKLADPPTLAAAAA